MLLSAVVLYVRPHSWACTNSNIQSLPVASSLVMLSFLETEAPCTSDIHQLLSAVGDASCFMSLYHMDRRWHVGGRCNVAAFGVLCLW